MIDDEELLPSFKTKQQQQCKTVENDTNVESKICGFIIPCINKRIPIKSLGLQKFATAKFALMLLCIDNFLQQFISNGLYSTSVSTLQKRFHLSSTEMGYIAGSYDVASVVGLVLIGWNGDKLNRPVCIGIGTLLMGMSSFIFILPHFIAPTYMPETKDAFNLCGNVTLPECSPSGGQHFKYFLLLGFTLFGFSMAPLYSLGLAYIDENSGKNKSALYNGIFYAVGGAGPAIGYLVGGGSLKLYTYLGQQPKDSVISASSWIGAWWLGYCLCGSLLVIVSGFIFILPKGLQSTKINDNKQNENTLTQETQTSNDDCSPNITVLSKVHCLKRNPIYIIATLTDTLNSMFIFGFNTFGSKYVETQFLLKPFLASIIYGSVAIFASIVAHLVSGTIISKLKLELNGIINYLVICSAISAICSLGFFIHCPNSAKSNYLKSLACSVAGKCNCSTDLFEPVCDGNITYFSPCFAGCKSMINSQTFSNCDCSINNELSSGPCENKICTNFYLFLILLCLGIFSSIMTYTPNMQIILRCVEFDSRVRAISWGQSFVKIFGNMPGRILTGIVVDLACNVWQSECGNKGSCVVYNSWEMARNMALIIFSETMLMFILYMLLKFVFSPKDNIENGCD